MFFFFFLCGLNVVWQMGVGSEIIFSTKLSFLEFTIVQFMETWRVRLMKDMLDNSQIEKTGVGWQIDVLDMFHTRPAHRA